MVDVGVIGASLNRIRWAFNEVMNLSANAGLVQIYLNVFGIANLLALRATAYFFAVLLRQANRQQTIAGAHLRSGGGRTWLDNPGHNSLRSIDPGCAVP